MKYFGIIALSGLAAFAAAAPQDSTPTSTEVAMSPQEKCLAKCMSFLAHLATMNRIS